MFHISNITLRIVILSYLILYHNTLLCDFTSHMSLYPGKDSSVGRAADCHVTGPGFNTHSKPGWGLTQPSIPLWVGKMSTSKNIG